jgi:hypothetical protein
VKINSSGRKKAKGADENWNLSGKTKIIRSPLAKTATEMFPGTDFYKKYLK